MTAAGEAAAPWQGSARLYRGLALFLLFNGLLLNGLLWLVSPADYKENTLNHTWDVLRGESADDSWGPMQFAVDQLATAPDAPLYTTLFFNRGVRFQYPPTALFTLTGMKRVAPTHVRTTEAYSGPEPTVNAVIGWLCLAALALCVAALFEWRGRALHGPGFTAGRPWRLLLALGFTITFYPLAKAYSLGQIQLWINAAFALALVAWVAGRPRLAGVLVGAVCLIKPHYGIVLLWAALRREWNFAVAAAAVVAVGFGASIAVYGFHNHVDYLSVLSFLSKHGEAYYPNQSVNGLLNRLMGVWAPADFIALEMPDGKFPPFNLVVYLGTLATSAVILLAALFRRRPPGDRDGALDFCLIVVSCTLASPIAWEHHLGVLLLAFALLLPGALGDRRRLAWLTAAYVLASTYVPVANLLAHTPLNVVMSYLLAAALVVLVLLHREGRTPELHPFRKTS